MPRIARGEPVVQAAPPVSPRVERLLFLVSQRLGRVRSLGGCVGGLAPGGDRQQSLVTGGFQVSEQDRDLGTGIGEVGDEPVDLVDQPFLVRYKAADVSVGEVNRAATRT